jgi:uncharacterized protein YjeT (DUF2065 family)
VDKKWTGAGDDGDVESEQQASQRGRTTQKYYIAQVDAFSHLVALLEPGIICFLAPRQYTLAASPGHRHPPQQMRRPHPETT